MLMNNNGLKFNLNNYSILISFNVFDEHNKNMNE